MSGQVTIEFKDRDYTIYVEEYESGSSTSFGARTLEQGFQNALEWLGVKVAFRG